ncbi:MAG: hypothetical protein IIA89_14215 [Chloroflexi bacterium]|nr:hypothetical protein [Chloroflexota bacterium]
MEEKYVLTPDEIIGAARKEGYSVSKHQLHRWRQRGLIARPRRKGLGRGKGTRSLYPAKTVPQVIEICRTLLLDRRLDLAAIALFFKGYPVSPEYIRIILEKTAEEDREAPSELDEGEGFTPKAWELVNEIVNGRLLQRNLSRGRGRLRSNFETFLIILLSIRLGMKPYFPLEGPDAKKDADIIEKGLGLKEARQVWFDLSADELKEELLFLAGHANQRSLIQTAEGITDDELEEARDEVTLLWEYVQNVKWVFTIVYGQEALGLQALPEIDFRQPHPQSPSILLTMLHLRTLPKINSQMRQIQQDAAEVAELRHKMETNPDLELIVPLMRDKLIAS